MQIVSVGVNHKTTPIEVRERLALLEEELPGALADLNTYVLEGAILSTCNRTELHGVVHEATQGLQELRGFLARCHDIPAQELAPHVYEYSGHDAVRHLFRVASGVDSMILGETEILGQVRDALVSASAAGTVGASLSRMFHWALRTGRRAREQTAISRHTVSISHAGVQMARQVFGGLEQCSVLVISAGEVGKLTAKSLRSAGAQDIGVANRTWSRAKALADELGGRPVEFDSVGSALADFDIVISATASANYVLSKATVVAAMGQRVGRPLCLIDIAVPRDIDPDSARIEDVHLYDIDDLEAVSLAGLSERRKAVSHVETIVEEEAQRFMEWFRSLEAVPLIRALKNKAEEIRLKEMKRSLAKLSHLSCEDHRRIDALSKALAKKLLHDPIVLLKSQEARKDHMEAVRDLFSLEAGEG